MNIENLFRSLPLPLLSFAFGVYLAIGIFNLGRE